MHDLLFAQDIFNQAVETAKQNGDKKIKSITIEMGEINHHHAQRGKNRAQRDHGKLLESSHLKFHLKNFFQTTKHSGLKIKFITTTTDKIVLKEIDVF